MFLAANERPIRRVAMISVHGCPVALPGMRTAGGMNVYLRQLAPMLAEEGVCIDIFTRSHEVGGPEIVELGPRARIVHIPAGAPYVEKDEIFGYLPEFTERLARFAAEEGVGYDLIHSHYWFSGWVGQRLASEWAVPHIVTFHTLSLVKQRASGSQEPPEREVVEQEVATSADCVVAFTTDEVDALADMYGVAPERIQVVPGGVDLDRFQQRDKTTARQRLGFQPHDQIMLYVGRLDPFKGPEVLLRTLHAMRGTPGAFLEFVGGEGDADPEAKRLNRLAQELGIADRVRWQSAVPQDELVDYYNAADVCVVPSYHESFGLAALEAMACGSPVVASRVGALKSLVVEGQTGCLVFPVAPEAFAPCLEELLTNEELRHRLGEGARKRATEFPWDQVVARQLGIYGRLASQVERRPEVVPYLS